MKSLACRLLYKEVAEMNRSPNFLGARILSFSLNVMGLERKKEDDFKDSRALHKAILFWTKKNYARLYSSNPRVAEACLVDGLTYDAANRRIVKTYPADGLNTAPYYKYLYIDPP